MVSNITGYAMPAGATWNLPNANTTPQFIVLDNGFLKLIGFNAGTYPATPTSSNQSYLSNFSPTMEPISNIKVLCNLINNQMSYPINLLTGFTANNTNFGDLISVNPSYPLYLDVNAGKYSYI